MLSQTPACEGGTASNSTIPSLASRPSVAERPVIGREMAKPSVATPRACAISDLTFLRDYHSGHNFLVDTGAVVSVLPNRCAPPSSSSSPWEVVDGKTIYSWGIVTAELPVCLGG
jgi:hypothetical protein